MDTNVVLADGDVAVGVDNMADDPALEKDVVAAVVEDAAGASSDASERDVVAGVHHKVAEDAVGVGNMADVVGDNMVAGDDAVDAAGVDVHVVGPALGADQAVASSDATGGAFAHADLDVSAEAGSQGVEAPIADDGH